jgi:hypothetical protein
MDDNDHRSEFRANAGLITWELVLPGPLPAEVWPVLRRLQRAAESASAAIDVMLAPPADDGDGAS